MIASSDHRQPFMLKDYLRDDFSSCSSNGFVSYPRCVTVRFCLDVDLRKSIERSKSKQISSSIAIAGFQRASEAVINVLKQFPFHSVKSPSKGLLPIRYSRKFFKKKFRRKTEDEEPPAPEPEINRGKSFAELLEDDRQSTRTTSSRKNVVEGPSTVENVKVWRNGEEKEQLSPVSILDCPFEDEDEDEVSSPFHPHLPPIKGTNQKLIIREEIQSSNDRNEEKSKELLMIFKATISSKIINFEVDNLLQEFFTEKLEKNCKKSGKTELLKEAEKWVNGYSEKMVLGWEMKEGRKAYVEEMEKGFWAKMESEDEKMGLDLEFHVFSSLLDEVLFDFLD